MSVSLSIGKAKGDGNRRWWTWKWYL